ncbi:Sec-independent protein translocase protein TatB [Phenylobacterium sp.]|uniref:Sec-independent protein translocase protein TatB n=1 Tax=Phenylobacterium sp. TaxID=1871053 RepID=UPI002736FCC1|nr:Sec-independent protein translocase protein TatB [Phenylobacterium sp.]MDP3660809.1 Sec-independent protein translocase protein TatB [Phenylobacterium sp.]
MLPEIGATELLVIAVVALIVVGPKDLPVLLRKLGQMMARLRGMAAEFRASFDEMARQSELDELRAEVEAMRRGQMADHASLAASEAQMADIYDELGRGLSGVTTQPQPALPADDPVPEAPASAPKPRKPRAAKPAGEAAAKPKTVRAAPKSKSASAAPKPRAKSKAKAT